MTDSKKLREKITASGLNIKFIATSIGITREGLYNKLNNLTEFKSSEIVKLTELLNLSRDERDDIFFAINSELNSLKDN